MVGAVGADEDVFQHVALGLLDELLEGGLVVSVDALGFQLRQILLYQRKEEVGDDLHTSVSRIQINGGQKCFKGIGQYVLFIPSARHLLAVAQVEAIADTDMAGIAGKGLGADHVLPHIGQHTLSLLLVSREQVAADGDGQYRIAQKFQPLVAKQMMVPLAGFVGMGGVGHGAPQQASIPEGIANRFLQAVKSRLVAAGSGNFVLTCHGITPSPFGIRCPGSPPWSRWPPTPQYA